MKGINKYRYASELSEFLLMIINKYRLKEAGVNVSLSFEKHLVDRMLDRSVTKMFLSTMITRLVKYHLCELLFLNTLDPNKRIDLWYDGFIMGCTVTEIREGEYNVKLRTIFKASNTPSQVNNYFKIQL